MKIEEIKNLTLKEFAERYPFVVMRDDEGNKCYLKETDEFGNKGDPVCVFTGHNFRGWNDILICWCEKVKPIFDQLSKEDQNSFYITILKEKYGTIRLCTSFIGESSYKINEYTDMVEHLSEYTCLMCGKRTKSSNTKKLITWRTKSGWISYSCKNCAKQANYRSAKINGVRRDFDIKCRKEGKNPLNIIFKDCWKRETGDWFYRATRWNKDGSTTGIKYDCRELLEGMY